MIPAALHAPRFAVRSVLGTAAGAVVAAGVGAAAAYGAYAVHPLAVPAALVGLALAIATINRPEVGIAAWFVLVPVGTMGYLGQPTWAVSSGWAVLLFGVALVHPDSRARAGGIPALGLPFGLLLALTVAQVGQTDDLAAATPVVRVLLVGGLVFTAIALLVRRRAQFAWAFGGLAAAAAIVAVRAVQEWRSGSTATRFLTESGELVNRAAAGFGQPNALAGFLLVLVPACVAAALIPRHGPRLGWLAAALAVGGIYVTFSRGALLALAVVPFAFLGLRRSLLIAPVLLVLVTSLTPGILRERFATATLQGSEAATRVDIWRTAASIWTEHPLAGVGPGAFPDAYATARVPGKQFLPDTQFTPPPHAHNLGLQLLAEQGLLGLTAYVLLLLAAIGVLLSARAGPEPWMRGTAAALLATLLAFNAHNLLDVTLLEGTAQVVWAIFGLAAALGGTVAAARARATEPT